MKSERMVPDLTYLDTLISCVTHKVVGSSVIQIRLRAQYCHVFPHLHEHPERLNALTNVPSTMPWNIK